MVVRACNEMKFISLVPSAIFFSGFQVCVIKEYSCLGVVFWICLLFLGMCSVLDLSNERGLQRLIDYKNYCR